MANSFTTIRLHLFLLLVLLLSPVLTDQLESSSDSVKSLSTSLSRRDLPISKINHPSLTKRSKTVVSNQTIKPASKKKSKKKSKSKPKNKPKNKPKEKPHSHKQKPSIPTPVRAPVHVPVHAPAPVVNPATIPRPRPVPVRVLAPAPAPAPIPAAISHGIPASIPAAISAQLSSTKKALKPNPTHYSHPQSIPARPSNLHPQSPTPLLNLHPLLPVYGAASKDQGSDIDRWVNGHNKVRKMYTVGDVKWSPKLAASALQHSQTCFFKHTSNNQYGENIAAGQQSIEQVMKEWVFGPGERDSYVRSDPTSHSHYTQVVWADTKEIGCALTTCNSFGGAALGPGPIKFWVCEYDPPGNVMGWSAKEVHAATGGAPLSGGYTSKFKHKRRNGFSLKH